MRENMRYQHFTLRKPPWSSAALILFLVAVPVCATAQAAQTAHTCLSLEKVLQLGAATDPAIGIALGEKEQSEFRLKQIKADWYPQISGYSRAAQGDIGLVDGRTDNQIGLIVSQRLFDFGKNKIERRAASASVTSAQFLLENAELNSVQTAAVSYINVLESQEKLQAARERENHIADITKTVARRFAAGTLTKAEASSIEAEYAKASSLRIEFSLDLEMARSKLLILTDQQTPPCNNMDIIDATFRANMPPSLVDAISMSATASPKLNAAKANLTTAKAHRKLAKRNQLPIVSAQGVSALIYDDFRNEWNRRERIGVEVSMPIWGGGRYKAQRSEASAKLRTSNMELSLLRRSMRERVSLSWYRINAFKELSRVRGQIVQSYRSEASAINKEFEAGLRTYQDVKKVEADLQDAVLSEIESQYSVRYEYLIFLALINKLQVNNLISINP
ncbi:MAG: hypothetical protein COB92_01535 [Robiginitomaculum sp.]|nr:MAG: hypothetical protein COB92_01535 [Robiginitomaculum sp.]